MNETRLDTAIDLFGLGVLVVGSALIAVIGATYRKLHS